MKFSDRYDRQRRLFGADGQQRLARATVAIVGIGGVGSHLCQQLAFLGVGKFILIDPDRVATTNLNRLIGATVEDVRGMKVEIASRMIRTISPDSKTTRVPTSFVSREAAEAMATADVILGAVDSAGARVLLTEFACAHDIPYIDTAADTDPEDPKRFGGHVLVSKDRGCVFCFGLVAPGDVRRDLSTPEERAGDDALYGIPAGALDDRGPSVVTLNGIVGSVAAMEFMKLVTGVVEPCSQPLIYDGRTGTLRLSLDEPRSCPYCEQRGDPDTKDWDRHIRSGLGDRLGVSPSREEHEE